MIQVSPGLEHLCAEEPSIFCRRCGRAGWLSLKPSERKSRISAGTCLPQVLLRYRKQDGRDKLHLSVCNKKKKPLRTDKMVQRHHICHSGTSGRQQFLFAFVCAAERRAWREGYRAGCPGVSSTRTMRATPGPVGSGAALSQDW